MKVMTFVGTRPELIKLSRIIAELDSSMTHVLVHTGQNFDYELNQIFFEQLGIRRPDVFLEAAGDSAMQTIATVLTRGDAALAAHQPDAVLLLGDTNSCLVVLAAKRRKIPIFHLEAGNRCFDQRVPEEINRKVVDHLSDVNLTYTEHARRYLLAEGLAPQTVIKTGSPMKEVLSYYRPGIDASAVLSDLGLQARGYFVVSAHREENVDVPARLVELVRAINNIATVHDIPVVFSVHPRTRKRLEATPELHLDERIRLMKPLGFLDYVRLQEQSFCVLSDSGTITEEASILGFPAVTLRQAHERPEGMDEGTLIMSDLVADRVVEAVRIVVAHAWREGARFREPADYDTELVSKKVVRIIASYSDYIRRTVWFEPTVRVTPG
jgi:UDP-N-acetylglucosamine 2-epimerase (non-hydrolysing)